MTDYGKRATGGLVFNVISAAGMVLTAYVAIKVGFMFPEGGTRAVAMSVAGVGVALACTFGGMWVYEQVGARRPRRTPTDTEAFYSWLEKTR